MDDVTAIIEQRAKLDASLDQAIADLEQEIADKTKKLDEARAARGAVDPPPKPKRKYVRKPKPAVEAAGEVT